jgi:hypothetical protein
MSLWYNDKTPTAQFWLKRMWGISTVPKYSVVSLPVRYVYYSTNILLPPIIFQRCAVVNFDHNPLIAQPPDTAATGRTPTRKQVGSYATPHDCEGWISQRVHDLHA